MPLRTLFLFLLSAGALHTAHAKNPNVVLILADDIGYECLGAYGGVSYQTPRLDRMAAQGVLFQNAHSLPICTPTRLSLMTGKYNSRNWKAFGIMDPDTRHIGHWMTEAGYRSALVGKWQLYSYNPPEFMPEWRSKGQRPEDAGFEEYFLFHADHTEDKGSRYPDPRIKHNGKYIENTEGKYGPALNSEFITDFIEKHQDEPFFVYYPMSLPHNPFSPSPDSPTWKTDRFEDHPKHFKSMVEYTDKVVGQILDKLDALNLRDDTLVIFYGDNGTHQLITSKMADGTEVPGGKALNNLRGTHVPLIVSYPKLDKAGHTIEHLADCNDILPTIFAACGLDLPKDEIFDGESLLPQIKGKKGKHRDWLFFHHDPLPGVGKKHLSLERWAMDLRWKFNETTGKLYDLIADPEETTPINPASSAEAKAAYKKLSKITRRFPAEYTPWTRD